MEELIRFCIKNKLEITISPEYMCCPGTVCVFHIQDVDKNKYVHMSISEEDLQAFDVPDLFEKAVYYKIKREFGIE